MKEINNVLSGDDSFSGTNRFMRTPLPLSFESYHTRAIIRFELIARVRYVVDVLSIPPVSYAGLVCGGCSGTPPQDAPRPVCKVPPPPRSVSF